MAVMHDMGISVGVVACKSCLATQGNATPAHECNTPSRAQAPSPLSAHTLGCADRGNSDGEDKHAEHAVGHEVAKEKERGAVSPRQQFTRRSMSAPPRQARRRECTADLFLGDAGGAMNALMFLFNPMSP